MNLNNNEYNIIYLQYNKILYIISLEIYNFCLSILLIFNYEYFIVYEVLKLLPNVGLYLI